MFFTPELLAKRDSGFGLLWLAATLGSRASFKKLPKRSVLTANITQLCDLIIEPHEPLALRLSSNLMFGVVRVYKVKQDIFMADVTNCATTLKKVVQDLHASGAADLHMANPSVRPSALTIVSDPNAAYALDFDAFIANWDEYLNLDADTTLRNDITIDFEDDDYDPHGKKKKQVKGTAKIAHAIEALRKEQHTLDEHHEHLFSASFDLSFSGGPTQGPSSQVDVTFDNFFPFSDGLDIGDGLGDDLARELGWNISPVKSVRSNRTAKTAVGHAGINVEQRDDMNVYLNHDFNIDDIYMDAEPPAGPEFLLPRTPDQSVGSREKNIENEVPSFRMGSAIPGMQIESPATSFSQQLLSQEGMPVQQLRDITSQERSRGNEAVARKKAKRTRLLLDTRTELTDDELKLARFKYLEAQRSLRRGLLTKRLEKDAEKFVEELIWGVPKGIQEQGLREFWKESFKVQVETRTGALRIDEEGPPSKKRKVVRAQEVRQDGAQQDYDTNHDNEHEHMYQEQEWGMGWSGGNDGDMAMIMDDPPANANRHSSEEPGQARRARSASILEANLGFDIERKGSGHGSQRSSLFPWDNAGRGPSSSIGNIPLAQPEFQSALEHSVDVRLRSSSLSRRGSPIVLNSLRGESIRGSVQGTRISFSPALVGRSSQIFGEEFEFQVDDQVLPEETQTQQETQRSELNLVTLERNSYNFLEYAKMQSQALSKQDDYLTFDIVVPKTTSTRHVAAAAFYHCLVLATKNLIRVGQPEPYGTIKIDVL